MYFMPISDMMTINKEQHEDIKKKIEECYGLSENMFKSKEHKYSKDRIFYVRKNSKEVGDIDIIDILIKDKSENRFYVNKHFFNYVYNMRVP